MLVNRGLPIQKVQLKLFVCLQALMKTLWWVVPIVWLPVVCWCQLLAIQRGLPFEKLITTMPVGLFIWSFVEYSLHRFLFHVNYNLLVSWRYRTFPCSGCPPVRYIVKKIPDSMYLYWAIMNSLLDPNETTNYGLFEFIDMGFWTGWILCTIYFMAVIINIPWMAIDWSSPQLLQHCSV